MKTRMQPIGVIWNKLPRLVRDVAHSQGKLIDLEMDGAETEVDKTIIEAMTDPFTHLIRNACDHGIEHPEIRVRNGKKDRGVLRLKACHEGGLVHIDISDDGGGVDFERVRQKAIERGLVGMEQAAVLNERDTLALLFLPGFSTAPAITHISGRGVGMDVVKANVEKIGGTVEILTSPGTGTTVKLKIPLTLAIIPALLVKTGGHRFAIPQACLLEVIELAGDSVSHIELAHEAPVYRHRGMLLPIAYLNELLKLSTEAAEAVHNVIVLDVEGRRFGLVVDEVNDTEAIVIKSLGAQLKGLPYSGAAIMSDGEVGLILDVIEIAKLAHLWKHSRESQAPDVALTSKDEQQKQRLLIFKSGSFDRLVLPVSVIARLEEIPLSSVERSGGRLAFQYRDIILPLIELSSRLEETSETSQDELIQVIVLRAAHREFGIIVDQIVDIVEDSVSMQPSISPRHGILGSAIIGEKVAEFLDLEAILETRH